MSRGFDMPGKWRRAIQAHESVPHVTQQTLDAAIATHAATPHGGNASWESITGKPATFPPEAHSHAVGWTDVTGKPSTFPPDTHSHTKADVGLGSVDNTADASKPISAATQTALDGKAEIGHDHAGVYEPANTNIQAHVASAHASADAQKNSDITKAEIEAKLTGEISSHTHAGGGSSPWAVIKKTASEARAANVTMTADSALVVALAAATRYRIYINVMLTTANANMDYKYDCNYTGTITSIHSKRKHAAAGSIAGTDVENTLAVTAMLPSTGVAATTTGIAYIEIEINILTNTSGTFQFRWAQNTSDAAALTVLAGSYLEYMTVA